MALLVPLLAHCGGGGGGGGSASSGGGGGGGVAPAAQPPGPPQLVVPAARAPLGAPPASLSGQAPAHVPGVLLVKQRARKGGPASVAGLASARGLSVRTRKAWPAHRLEQVELLSPGIGVEEAIKRLSSLPEVEYAEPDYLLRTHEVIPNDPSFGTQWGLRNTGQSGGTAGADIEATLAWDTTQGSDQVVVAVIDTGIDYDHPDLAANMWRNPGETPGNGIDDDGNGYVDDVFGIDAAADTGDPMDDNDHGTHVAGTVGAVTGNGVGVAGVAPQVRLMALKFLTADGSGSTSDAITCVDYAVARGAHVINASWGGGGFSQSLSDAISRAQAANILFVAAAGNEGTDNDGAPHYPSNYELDNVIAVGASTRTEGVASFSNFGATSVDLFAPGASILSTTPNNTYSTFSGTSMAAPHVAGVAALLRAQSPGETYLQTRVRLLSSVESLPAYQSLCVTGGRLNARLAVTSTLGGVSLVGMSPAAGVAGDTVSLTGLGFGATRGAGQVTFGGAAAASYTSWSDGQIRAVVPQGLTAGPVTVQVTNNASQTSNTLPFQVDSSVSYTEQAATYDFRSVAGSGQALTLADDGSQTVSLGFTFPFYGVDQTQVTVSANGYLTFGGTGSIYTNVPIPSTSQPNSLIAPLWMDLNPASGGSVHVATRGAAPNREFVAEWIGVPRYPAVGAVTFQAVLREATSDVVFHYQDTVFGNGVDDNGAEATVGVENATGTRGTQRAGLVTDGSALRYFVAGSEPPPPAPPAPTPSPSPSVPLESLNLTQGWNLFSFPLRELTQVQLGGGIQTVFAFDGASQGYQAVTPTVAGFNAGAGLRRGFWVYASQATQIQYDGLANDGSLRTVDLAGPGWNLVGVPFSQPPLLDNTRVTDLQTQPTPAPQPFPAVAGPAIPGVLPTMLFSYMNQWVSGAYLPFDATEAGLTLQPKRGYWLYAWRPVRLEFEAVVVNP